MSAPRPALRAIPSGEQARFIREEVRRSIRVVESLELLAPSDVVRRVVPRPSADLVSVIMPMRNAREWIEASLKSLLIQTHSNIEVFCIDDGSTDDSYERVVRTFGADRRLCVVRLKRGVGPYQIKNWAIATMVRGRYVAMQDADDLSHPTRVELQLRWMQRHGFHVSGTCVHQFSQDGTRMRYGTRPALRLDGRLHNLVFYPTLRAVRIPRDYRSVFGKNRFSMAKHGSQLFEYAVLREFGGFDGRTAIVGDSDLNWRLLRFMDIGNVPTVLYSRRVHAASLTRQPDTGYGSPARKMRRRQYDRMQRRIAECLTVGNAPRVRTLCTQDLFCAGVEVEEIHSGFNFGSAPATGGRGTR